MNKVERLVSYDCQSPVIIIGAGRSGSTLLSAIFNEHPGISFFGESYFLAPHVWQRVFEKHGLVMSYLSEWRNPKNLEGNEFEISEQRRVGELIAQFVADVMKTDPESSRWGYKEIWNGSPQFESFDWQIYDLIFPRAKYIHLVRNPFRYAISTAGRKQKEFTRKIFEDQLNNWVKMHEYNSQRADTGRYYLVRYEDIVGKPKETIREVLEFVGIEWNVNCLNVLQRRYVPSLHNPLEGKNFFSKPFKDSKLYTYVEQLDYLDDVYSMGAALKKSRSFFLNKKRP